MKKIALFAAGFMLLAAMASPALAAPATPAWSNIAGAGIVQVRDRDDRGHRDWDRHGGHYYYYRPYHYRPYYYYPRYGGYGFYFGFGAPQYYTYPYTYTYPYGYYPYGYYYYPPYGIQP